MAQMQILDLSLTTCLTFSLILTICSSSSSHDQQHFQVLDVAASLHQARQVVSPDGAQKTVITPNDDHHLQPSFNLTHGNGNSSTLLSLTLHSRSSLPFSDSHHNNYTFLTLFRLARDSARVRAILSHQSESLSRHSHHRHHSSSGAAVAVRSEQIESLLIPGVRFGSGEYFTRVGVGQPAKEGYMTIDTGSDVSWIQCKPCEVCYNQVDPIYNPFESSTYRSLACNSEQCKSLAVYGCRADSCLYEVNYGDRSSTFGNFATETISFGSSGSVPNVAIGCGHDNEGLFNGAAGLMGLGGGALSIPSQIKATSFSYCLVDRDSLSSSTLDFNSFPPADSVVVPQVDNPPVNTFRYVELTGINIGGRPVRLPPNPFGIEPDGRGGVIVDSGTAVTRFRPDVYDAVRDTFVSFTRDIPRAKEFSLFDTCYDLSSMATVRVPTVSFEFAGGKTLPLPPKNFLVPVDQLGHFCYAFSVEDSGSTTIIGNVQQQGTRVHYDLANKYVAFSPNKC